ncbi:MAG TPA: hypothetical protein VHJ82_01195 [Actinomycetota bacterium]|nr:hypothetical protein [Actinomycetota bacterium]
MTRERSRRILLGLGAARALLYVIAIPLAPLLYADHFLALVVLRPTKEVFVAAGFALRQGEIGLLELTAAAVPLSVLGVWLFFFLGRAYSSEIRGNRLGGIAGRLLRSEKINDAAKILRKKGDRLIVLGRMALVASTPIAAAAGTIKLAIGRFLRADGAGALISFVVSVSAGYALGEAYEQAGPWLTALAAAALLTLTVLAGVYIKRS